MLGQDLFNLPALLGCHPFQVQANVACIAKEVTESFSAFAEVKVLFALIDGKVCLRPGHLLQVFKWELHTYLVRSNPDAGTNVAKLYEEHNQQNSQCSNGE